MQTRFLFRFVSAAIVLLIVLYVFSNASFIAERSRKLSEYTSTFRAGLGYLPPDKGSGTPDGPPDHDSHSDSSPDESLVPEKEVHEETLAPEDDKIVVIGRLEKEDTNWVHDNLPEWQNAIYTVDNTSAALHTPRNKGREANVYLLYIIQNYHKLPSTIVFLHAHRDGWPTGWHNDVPNYDNVIALRTLNIDFVQRNGYANMRCNWVPGCPDEVQWRRPSKADSIEEDNTEHKIPDVWHHFFGEDSVVPDIIATPCCAQFAVSRAQVHRRPLSDYQRYHQWLMDTTFSDQVSGTIMEYLWHIIFGQTPVYCPEMNQCYRDVYGRGA